MNRGELRRVLQDQALENERILKDRSTISRQDVTYWRSMMGNPLVMVSMGARRAGKTVFAHELLRGKAYASVNFDHELLANVATGDLNDILESMREMRGDFDHILLDEIQNVAGWELFVNRLQRSGLKVLITGSNANLLGGELATHLTGRHLKITVLPFSFSEYLAFRKIAIEPETTKGRASMKRELRNYMETGGFPEVVRDASMSAHYLSSYYHSILGTDIIARHGIRKTKAFREMASAILSNFSNLITFNKLGNVHGFGPHTAKNYVQFMSEAYLVFLMDKYSNKSREIANSPKKVYAVDTGLTRAVAAGTSENLGRLLENLAYLQLVRRQALDPMMETYYWRDYQDREVDFIVKRGQRVESLLQVTAASGRDEVPAREAASLVRASESLKCRDLTVLTWDFEDTEKRNGKSIRYVPMWRWLVGR